MTERSLCLMKYIDLHTHSACSDGTFTPSELAAYAAEKGKLEKLANAAGNIDSEYRKTYLRVDLYEKDGKPCISFSRFLPKKNVKKVKSTDDLILTHIQEYKSEKACNPLKFALHKIIRLGYDVPNYKLFKEVVVKRHHKIK